MTPTPDAVARPSRSPPRPRGHHHHGRGRRPVACRPDGSQGHLCEHRAHRRQPVPAAHRAGPDQGGTEFGVETHVIEIGRHQRPRGQPAGRHRGRQRPHRGQLVRLRRRHHQARGGVSPTRSGRSWTPPSTAPTCAGSCSGSTRGRSCWAPSSGCWRPASTRASRSRTSSARWAPSTCPSSAAGTRASRPASRRSTRTRTIIEAWGTGFNDPAGSKELALAQFAQGAKYIFAFAAAGNSGIFEAAKEQGFFTSGVDTDQRSIDPGAHRGVGGQAHRPGRPRGHPGPGAGHVRGWRRWTTA